LKAIPGTNVDSDRCAFGAFSWFAARAGMYAASF
jgi:hypothetical protein